jgi:hypothetical protein
MVVGIKLNEEGMPGVKQKGINLDRIDRMTPFYHGD